MIAFGWMNFSAADMKRTKKAIAALKASGSVDELGISIIRNGFAEKLFPGLNVMQTSLKYYLLIPAMLHDIEKDFQTIKENEDIQNTVLKELIKRECIFCDAAVDVAPGQTGIIGSDSVGKKPDAKRMLRFPHSIYRHGIDIFGLLPPGGFSSLRDFCEGMRERRQRREDTDEKTKNDKKLPWGDGFKIYNQVCLKPTKAPDQEKTNPLALTDDEFVFLAGKMLQSDKVTGTALEKILLSKSAALPHDAVKGTALEKILLTKSAALPKVDISEASAADSAQKISEAFKNFDFGDIAARAAKFGIFMRCAFLAYNIAYRMYCLDLDKDKKYCDDKEINDYYKELYTRRDQVADDCLSSIPDEFGFKNKTKGNQTWNVMNEFLTKFVKAEGGIPERPQEKTLNDIQKIMTDWETAAKKKVPHLKKPDPLPEKNEIEWIGMDFLDFRYNTAVRIFADPTGKG